MRKLITLAVSLAALGFAGQSLLAQATPNLPPGQKRVSPHETISTVLGERGTPTRVTITYGRPYTKDSKTGEMRKIWGGLVPYGKADRMGSDEATLLLTQSPMEIQGKTIAPGAYTLYIVPTEAGAKIAFSTNLGKWGIPVDETKDVARFDLTKAPLSPQVDQLTLALEKGTTANSGVIKIMWETTQFSLPFTLKP